MHLPTRTTRGPAVSSKIRGNPGGGRTAGDLQVELWHLSPLFLSCLPCFMSRLLYFPFVPIFRSFYVRLSQWIVMLSASNVCGTHLAAYHLWQPLQIFPWLQPMLRLDLPLWCLAPEDTPQQQPSGDFEKARLITHKSWRLCCMSGAKKQGWR